MAKTRRAYTGGAASTTTSSNILSSGTTSFTITAYTGWPYGSDPFFVVVEPGTANEEKILVTRTGSTDTTVNVYATPSVAANRGADGTSAVAHSSGVTVFPVFTALDADEANELASKWSAKGDLVSYGSSTFEKLGVGADDTVLIADSGEASGLKWGAVDTEQLAAGAVTAAKVDALVPLGARNLVYNGAMQVAQRGTSATGVSGTSYNTADRWNTVLGIGVWTQSVENDAPTGSGFRKSLKMLCTTADAAPAAGLVNLLQQIFEGQDLQHIKKGTSDAEQLTLSFWVKSNVTGTYIACVLDNDNTRICSASYSVVASGTWEKKTITFPADTTGALDNDNNVSFRVQWLLGAGTDWTSGTLNTTWASTVTANRAVGQTNVAAATNNYWQITGVQLETGPVATPFEHLPYGEELAKCERYYQTSLGTSSTHSITTTLVVVATSTAVTTGWPLRTTMRAAPTVTVFSRNNNSGKVSKVSDGLDFANNVIANVPNETKVWGIFDALGGFTAGVGYEVSYTASAEL